MTVAENAPALVPVHDKAAACDVPSTTAAEPSEHANPGEVDIARDTTPVNPSRGVTVTDDVATWPAIIVELAGLAVSA